jgi:hypothetical protein
MRIASRPWVCLSSFASFLTFVSLACAPRAASAQPPDAVGVRAAGMGGAFTAVADDATASWWNPAGMAGGAYFNALIESGAHREPPDDRTSTGEPQSAWRANTRSVAVAFPALGLSYYRLRISEMQPQSSIAPASVGRQEGGAAEVRLRSTVLTQVGASVGQSLGSHFVVGATFKLASAGATSATQSTSAASLDAADALDPSGETHVGVDAGAMAMFGRVRVGLMVRNVTEPQYGSGAAAFTLDRQARLGAAVTSGTRGVIGSATVAVDADLTRTGTVFGEERRLAAGGEVWSSAKTFGVRAGAGVNTIGARRASGSAGASVAIKKGMYADGELTGGTDQGRKGWGVGLRLTF